MQYRTLGKTGLKVSILAYGGSSLGGAFREVDEAEGIRAVRTCSGVCSRGTVPRLRFRG